jgi:hypothetical protein
MISVVLRSRGRAGHSVRARDEPEDELGKRPPEAARVKARSAAQAPHLHRRARRRRAAEGDGPHEGFAGANCDVRVRACREPLLDTARDGRVIESRAGESAEGVRGHGPVLRSGRWQRRAAQRQRNGDRSERREPEDRPFELAESGHIPSSPAPRGAFNLFDCRPPRRRGSTSHWSFCVWVIFSHTHALPRSSRPMQSSMAAPARSAEL